MTGVRRLDLADGPTVVALLRLQRAAYAVEAALIGSDAIPALHEDATALAACGETVLGVDGSGGLRAAVGYKRAGAVVDLHRLVVDPGAFRQGHARRLLDAVAAAEPDATRTVVATGSANAPALALYARRGFVVTGERRVGGGLAITHLELRRPPT